MSRTTEIFLKYLKRGLGHATEVFVEETRRKIDSLVQSAEEKLLHLQKKMMMLLASGLVLVATFLFFVLALFYFLKEFADFPNTYSFLILALASLIFWFILKQFERRSHEYEKEK